MDFKLLGLWIWISIVTGLGLENTWTANLDDDDYCNCLTNGVYT